MLRITPVYTGNSARTNQQNTVSLRVILVYTGNSTASTFWPHVQWDYPRIHGEQTISLLPVSGLSGSPPHTRGTAAPFRRRQVVGRITPAYTGNSSLGLQQYGCSRDHPRIHGEQDAQEFAMKGNPGSPPHTRGTVN